MESLLEIEIYKEELPESDEEVEYLIDVKDFTQPKKCGEIFLNENNEFIILCIICKSSYDLSSFYTHINDIHKDSFYITENKDPLEYNNNSSNLSTSYTDNDESFLHEDLSELLVLKSSQDNLNEHQKQNEEIESNESYEKEDKENNEFILNSDENKCVHTKIETIKIYECQYCDLGFSSFSKREKHKKIHKGEKPFSCRLCGKSFRIRIACEQHEIKHNKEYKCKFCSATFTTSKSCSSHMLRHGEKRFSCNYCDKKFFFNMEKKTHERIHTGERPHQCNICNRGFITSGHLNEHIKIHMGYKSHKCSYCDKSFYKKSSLNEHIVLHTEEKPFVCKICDTKFAQRRKLKLHMKIHLDGKRDCILSSNIENH